MEDLKNHQESLKKKSLCELLNDSSRVKEVQFVDSHKKIMLDASHSKLDETTLSIWEALLKEKDIESKKKRMFQGEVMNSTENRAVLHTALRGKKEKEVLVDGQNVMESIHQVLTKIELFSEQVRGGSHKGYSGETLDNTLVIGIGGSYLSIEFVYEALRLHYPQAGKQMRFLANVDPIDFMKATEGLDPARTLVVVNSKTFTTAETMLNAQQVRKWVLQHYKVGEEKAQEVISKHVVACSTNIGATQAFGIETTFQFWDWVGGRFSVCSCIGVLPLALHFGMETVNQFLAGARDMDEQFMNNTLKNNLPTLLGLIGFTNSQVHGLSNRAIIPYCQALSKFVAHVQQMDMESNGKQVTSEHKDILDLNQTGTIIFGEPGTNSQHSFFQLLHQGREVPVEFIGYTTSQNEISTHEGQRNHHTLMSNFFSQPDALALGKNEDTLKKEGVKEEILRSKVFKGERGSISLLFKGALDAFNCGQLLAMYEHRVAVEGWLLGVNSFDQMGVELGKVLAKDIGEVLLKGKSASHLNHGTQNILSFYQE